MPKKVRDPRDFVETLALFLLIFSFLLGLGLVQWRRQQASFTLQVVSGHPPVPVSAPTISLNRATAEELTLLPGVGPKLAERIVAYRTHKGRFVNLDDLMDVKGIGPKLYGRIAPHLRLDGSIPLTIDPEPRRRIE